jgi:hypothetical protein
MRHICVQTTPRDVPRTGEIVGVEDVSLGRGIGGESHLDFVE